MKQIKPFRHLSNEWKEVEEDHKIFHLPQSLRIGVLNVLTNQGGLFTRIWNLLLRPMERYQAILREIKLLNADILALNEVSLSCLKIIQDDPFIQEKYFISDIQTSRTTKNQTIFNCPMGNILLSKIQPSKAFYLEFKETKLERGAVIFQYTHPTLPKLVAFACVHLSAWPKPPQNRIKELQNTFSACGNSGNTNIVVMGDMNLNSEKEDSGTEEIGVIDLWKLSQQNLDQQFTFDAQRNSLIQVKFFGLVQFRARLDRICMDRDSIGLDWYLKTPVQTFADSAIYPHTWDYLYPSDHFGIYAEICSSKPQAHEIKQTTRQQQSLLTPSKARTLFTILHMLIVSLIVFKLNSH
jgi:endonuclease/exonuclease/phosphatase family metal-dependent hydrolase